MRAAVLLFPGINAEQEMARALSLVGFTPEFVESKATSLPDVKLVAIPGGFSYGDYLRSGALAKVAPVIPALRSFADRGGHVLGVCNGFQILTETGLLPGALLRNDHGRFSCKNICIRDDANGPFSEGKGALLHVPIAHGDGRFHIDDDGLAKLRGEGLVAYRYTDAKGSIETDGNPNGSRDAIAGIYGGPKRNILGMMPHPERMCEPLHGGVDGEAPFRRVFAALSS
ncbi:MAG: phosphoribosylformylglycinamidine synthase subunit PurQ [Polyangiaceae bacterium]|nr:phosphoribosylformylglycinamidine synthase subunit PurQ [Polyangiaceae bacterium]